jgi:hypothetical protein
MTNYRLISSLTSFSKVSEKVICKAQEQIGFRHSASTYKACYRLTDEILNVLNNRMTVGGIFGI